jgi:putative oxidoreductase
VSHFWTDLASLVLRVGLAGIFVYHGLRKILPADTHLGSTWMTGWFGVDEQVMAGLPSSFNAVQVCVAWGELIGGIALGLGLLTRVAALGLIIIQSGAAFFVITSPGMGFSPIKGGGPEYNFVLLTMCLCLLFLTAGRFSLDQLLFGQAKSAPGTKSAAEPISAPALVSASPQ